MPESGDIPLRVAFLSGGATIDQNGTLKLRTKLFHGIARKYIAGNREGVKGTEQRRAKSQSRKDGKGAKTGTANPKFKIRNSYCCLLPQAYCLLNHFIRLRQHLRRDRQGDLLGGLEIDDKLKLGRLLDWDIGGLGAFEDLVDKVSGAPP